MKKLVLLASAIALCMTSFAQTKGQKYVAGSIAAEFGSQNTTQSLGSYSVTENSPLGSSFDIGVEGGYFIMDNLRIGIGVATALSNEPTSEVDNVWLKDSSKEISITPNVAYYIKLTDNLYYTPEIGLSLVTGSISSQTSKSESYKLDCKGFGLYLNFAAFEFRVKNNLAIGLNVGGLSLTQLQTEYEVEGDEDIKVANNQTKLALNNSSISVKWYF